MCLGEVIIAAASVAKERMMHGSQTVFGMIILLSALLSVPTWAQADPAPVVEVDVEAIQGDALLSYLHRDATDPVVVQLIKDLGVPKESSLAAGHRALDYADMGLSLVFYFDRLEEIHFYGVGVEGFSLYPGTLPKGLVMPEGRVLTGKRLGAEQLRPLAGSPWTWIRYPDQGVDGFFAGDTTRALIFY